MSDQAIVQIVAELCALVVGIVGIYFIGIYFISIIKKETSDDPRQ